MHAEGTVTSMIVLIGMAVGVDYSLFYLKREREEREAGRTTLDAVEIAAQTSGHSILVSGAAVIAALSGLFLMGDATFNSLAVGSILVVGVAVLGSLTVLPALLVLLGHWVDRPRVPLLWRLNRRIGRGGLSSRLLAPVLKHPVAALIASVIVMMLLALPALGLRMHSGNIDTLPASITEVQTLRDLQKAFPVEGASATVVVQSDAADAESAGQALRRLEADAIATGDFVASDDEIRSSDDGTTHALRLAMPYEESDERVDEALRDLRDDLAPAALSSLDEYAVGGGAAESLDNSDMLAERLPIVVGFVLLLTLLIMAVTFRSIPIAIVSTLLNLGSVGVSFGLLALVFQNSWAEGLLDFDQPGLRDRLDPGLRAGGPGRALDGLPRVRGQPDPRARARRHDDEAGGRAGSARDGQRDHVRGRGDDLGVRDLRDAEHAGDEDDGRRAVRRDPLRRHARAAGDAAGDPGAPGRAGLVAGPAEVDVAAPPRRGAG